MFCYLLFAVCLWQDAVLLPCNGFVTDKKEATRWSQRPIKHCLQICFPVVKPTSSVKVSVSFDRNGKFDTVFSLRDSQFDFATVQSVVHWSRTSLVHKWRYRMATSGCIRRLRDSDEGLIKKLMLLSSTSFTHCLRLNAAEIFVLLKLLDCLQEGWIQFAVNIQSCEKINY